MTNDELYKLRRFRCFDIVIYPDCHTYHSKWGKPIAYYELLERICKKDGLKEYAYIMHDCDVDKDGKIEKQHYHLWLKFINQHTIQQLSNEYGIPCTNFSTFKHMVKVNGNMVWDGTYEEPNRKLRLQYLVHSNNPEKVHYDVANIHTNISGFQFDDKEPLYTTRDIIEYRKSHTFEQTYYFCLDNGIDGQLKKLLPILDRIEKENTAFYSNVTRAYAMTLSDMEKSVNEYVHKVIDAQVPDCIREGWQNYK